MDPIKQVVQVEDQATSTIERIEAAWKSYNDTVASGVAPAEALDAAFAGVLATQDGMVPSLTEITDLMATLGISATDAAAALDVEATAADGLTASLKTATTAEDAEAQADKLVAEQAQLAAAALKEQSASLDTTAASASRAAEAFGVQGASQQASLLSINPLTVGIVAAGVAFGVAGKEAIDWQAHITAIQNNTTMTAADTQHMSDVVKKMAQDTGADLNKLADGYMHIQNLNYQGADAVKILDAATKSAVSTNSDEAKVIDVLASVMREYNAQGSEAPKYMDLLHNAAAQGNMTLEQFTTSGKAAIGTASQMGVSLQDVSAVYAALTRHGYDAAQAGTQIVGMLSHIINPAASARKEIALLDDAQGTLAADFTPTGLAAKGLSGVLTDVRNAVGDNTQAFFKLIPAMRGGRGELALDTKGFADMNQVLQSQNDVIAGKSTPTAVAFAASQETTAYKMAALSEKVKVLSIDLGDKLLPAINKVIGTLDDITPSATKAGGAFDMVGKAVSGQLDMLGTEWDMLTHVGDGFGLFSEQVQKAQEKHDAAVTKMHDTFVTNMGDMVAQSHRDAEDIGTSAQEIVPTVQEAYKAMVKAQDEQLQIAEQNASNHMNAILDYMKISKQTGDAGREMGQAFADYTASTLQLAVDIAHNDMLAIERDTATAAAAMAELAGIKIDASEARDHAAADLANARAINAATRDQNLADQRENSAHTMVEGSGHFEAVQDSRTPAQQKLMAAEAKADTAGAKSAATKAAAASKAAAAADKALAQAQQTATAELQAIADKNALAAATDKVTAAQDKLTADNLAATATMKDQANQMAALKQKEADAMGVADAGVKNSEAALAALKATHKDAYDKMTEQIYQYNQQLLQVKAQEEALIAPLQKVADQAQAALDAINNATAKQDRVYTHMKEAMQDAAFASAEYAKQIMGPLNAALAAANAAVTAQQAAIQGLTDKYANELFPIQQKLAALQNQQSASQRAKVIGDEAQTVGNLAARLANLVVGTAEYNAVKKQMDDANKKLGQDEQINSLTDQQNKIQSERDKALKAANDQLKVLQATQKMAQENVTAEQKLIDAQKQAAADRMAALDKEIALYDRQQRDKAQAATDAKTTADANLKAEQDRAKAREQIISDEIKAVQEKETVYKHQADAEEKQGQALVDGAKNNAQAIKDAYKGIQDDLTARTKAIQDYLASVKTIDDNNVKASQTDKKALDDSINARKDAAALAKATADDMKAFGDNAQTANDKLTAMTPLLQGVAPAMNDAGNAITGNFGPAINSLATTAGTSMGTVAQTFMDYIGGPSQTTDNSKNIPWQIDGRNKEGFFSRIIFFFDEGLGLNGLRGMTDKRLKEWETTFQGHLDDQLAYTKTGAAKIGDAIITGIEGPLNDPTKQAALGSAIADAVKAAMADAQKKLAINSPSLLAGSMLGEPISEGIGYGITGGAYHVSNALNNVLMGALSGAQGQGGTVPVGVLGGGLGGGSQVIQVSANVSVVLPNVTSTRNISNDPNDYKGAAIAIEQATAYELARRGISTRTPAQRSRV